MTKNMIFLGPPGIGKGTHAGLISKKFSIPQISTGDLLRENVKKGTELGLEAKKYMDAGDLVPDELVIKLLKARIDEDDCKDGYILDGFPRTIPQAESLESIASIDLVVNFDASRETIIQRISGRLTCRKCGAIYHRENMPPKQEGVCDKCGGELYQRDDQKPDVVRNRLEVYEKQTAPLIDFYRKKGILADVDVIGDIDEVHSRILNLVTQKLNR